MPLAAVVVPVVVMLSVGVLVAAASPRRCGDVVVTTAAAVNRRLRRCRFGDLQRGAVLDGEGGRRRRQGQRQQGKAQAVHDRLQFS